MNMNKLKHILIVALFIIVMFLFVILFFPSSIKYANDYSSKDMLNAQKIILGIIEPTEEIFEKYDINEDGEITYTDVQIMQQMILGFYDSYEIKNNKVKAIKYREVEK